MNLIQAVRDLAERFPNSVYMSVDDVDYGDECHYFEGEVTHCPETGCIIGQAIRNLPESPVKEDLLYVIRSNPTRNVFFIMNELEALSGSCPFSHYQKKWLGCVQGQQDFGRPWATCVEMADQRFGVR